MFTAAGLSLSALPQASVLRFACPVQLWPPSFSFAHPLLIHYFWAMVAVLQLPRTTPPTTCIPLSQDRNHVLPSAALVAAPVPEPIPRICHLFSSHTTHSHKAPPLAALTIS